MATKPITLIFIFYQRNDGQAAATLLRSVLLSGDQPFDGSFSEDGARRYPATSTWVSEPRNLVRQHIFSFDQGCRWDLSPIRLFVNLPLCLALTQINPGFFFNNSKQTSDVETQKRKLFSTNQASNVVGQVEQAAKKLNQSFSSSRKIINQQWAHKQF